MEAGRLRHRITIESPADSGGGEKSWSDYATVWASYEPLRGREFVAVQQVNAEVTGKVVMRYLAGVNAEMRILFEGRYLAILSVVDVEERHRDLELMVKETV